MALAALAATTKLKMLRIVSVPVTVNGPVPVPAIGIYNPLITSWYEAYTRVARAAHALA